MKLEYFKEIFNYVDDELFKYSSSDIFFTYVAAKNKNDFIYVGKDYFVNMPVYNEIEPLHNTTKKQRPIISTWRYLTQKFGDV